MILGVSTQMFTLVHVLISLIGIATGFVVAYGLWTRRPVPAWTAWFLTTTALTSVTGFLFHSTSFGPPHILGILSLLVLAIALYALYGAGLGGRWRSIYVVTGLIALYFNVLVAVIQAFQKIPALHGFAPTGQEPLVGGTQLVVLAAFVTLTVGAVRRYRVQPSA